MIIPLASVPQKAVKSFQSGAVLLGLGNGRGKFSIGCR